MLYKPVGFLSQLRSNDPKEIGKKDLLSALYDFPEGVMVIGRLDFKSEGLLLLTDKGKLADQVNRSGVEKEYWVMLDGEISDRALSQLGSGMGISLHGKPYKTKPCKVERLADPIGLPPPDAALRIERHRKGSWIKITLTEGKFRQIRKMTAGLGYPTQRLIRMRIGSLHLGDLVPGAVKAISLEAHFSP